MAFVDLATNNGFAKPTRRQVVELAWTAVGAIAIGEVCTFYSPIDQFGIASFDISITDLAGLVKWSAGDDREDLARSVQSRVVRGEFDNAPRTVDTASCP